MNSPAYPCFFRKFIISAVLIIFISNTLSPYALAQTGPISLPEQILTANSQALSPFIIKGMTLSRENPLKFEFIIDKGDRWIAPDKVISESRRLIKYFLASLTIPKKDLWVNLSPYEKDRMISDAFGQTEMGRDLLAQDHVLKQMSAALMFPEKEVGKKFWDTVYQKIAQTYGRTDLAVDTFHKVWIVPQNARVLVHGETAYIVDSHLTVMLEEDYLAARSATQPLTAPLNPAEASDAGKVPVETEILRTIIIPELEKEVNTGASFTTLRQIYNAMILALWYKQKIQNTLTSAYADKNKVSGINSVEPAEKEQIYQSYLRDLNKGIVDYVKEDQDPVSSTLTPRHYFAGGAVAPAMISETAAAGLTPNETTAVAATPADRLLTINAAMAPTVDSTIPAIDDDIERFITETDNPYWLKMQGRVNLTAENAKYLNPAIIRKLTQPENVIKGWEHTQFLSPTGESYEASFFHVRVISDTTNGPAKGGIRWVLASDLMKEIEFVEKWDILIAMNPSEDQVNRFVEKWIQQEAQALALGMTLKTAGSRLPLGGGKGAVFIGKIVRASGADGKQTWGLEDYNTGADGRSDWSKFPAQNKARIARAHALAMARSGKIGPDRDIPAPDVRTDSEILQWYADEYLRYLVTETDIIRNYDQKLYTDLLELTLLPADPVKTPFLETAYNFWLTSHKPFPWAGVFTGKDPKKYGVAGRTEATGFGVVDIIKYFIPNLAEKTAAVQGFGNVGSYACLGLVQNSAPLKVINDLGITLIKTGTAVWTEPEIQMIIDIMADKRIPLREIWRQNLIKTESITAILDDNKAVSNAVLTADVDILVTASPVTDVINKDNADTIKAEWEFEGANGPTSAEGEAIMIRKGIKVIADSLANAGGVTVSNYETDQTNGDHLLTQEETSRWRSRSLTVAARAVQAEQEANPNITMRQAFDLSAIKHIVTTKYRQLIAQYNGDLTLIAWAIDQRSPEPVAELEKDLRALGLYPDLVNAQAAAPQTVNDATHTINTNPAQVGGIDFNWDKFMLEVNDTAATASAAQSTGTLNEPLLKGLTPVIDRVRLTGDIAQLLGVAHAVAARRSTPEL